MARSGHIQPDCRKKKKDDAEKKKKEESGSGSGGHKAANSHILVPTSVSIQEVNDNIGVACVLLSACVDDGQCYENVLHVLSSVLWSNC